MTRGTGRAGHSRWEASQPIADEALMPDVIDYDKPMGTGHADRIGAKLDADLERERVVHPTITQVHGLDPYAWMASMNWTTGMATPPEPYTPNTDQVRAAYVRAMRNAFIASAGEHEQEFDRWLENLIAEVVQDVRHE